MTRFRGLINHIDVIADDNMKDPRLEQEKIDQLSSMVMQGIESGRYTEAKSNVEKLLKIQPLSPFGLFCKGLIQAKITDEKSDLNRALKEYEAAVKAGKAYKAKQNRLESQFKKLSKGYLDALFNFRWALKQNVYPIPYELRDAIEKWIVVCEFGLMYYGLVSEAASTTDPELAGLMQIPKHKFDLGMYMWTFLSDDYESIPFATDHFLIPAIGGMTSEERNHAIMSVNRYAVQNHQKFEVWYETFMDIWMEAGGFSDRFEAAADQLPNVASYALILARDVDEIGHGAYYYYRSIYEYSYPLSVRRNIIKAHRNFDSIIQNSNYSKDVLKSAKAYAAVFKDLFEITSFIDGMTAEEEKECNQYHANDEFDDYDPYPLLDELYGQYTKMLKNKKEIEHIRSQLKSMYIWLCMPYSEKSS